MKIQGFTTLFGPNAHTEKPLLGMFLDLEDYAERPSSTFPGFPERLYARLPGLIEHRCSPGHRGGFLERLAEGTYLGHICEHVTLELSDAAGIPVHFGRTVSTQSPSVYLVLVAYETEGAMRVLLEGSVALVQAVIDDRPFDIDALVAVARERAAHEALGPSTQCIVNAAIARGIPVRRRKGSLVQLGWGVRRRLIQAAVTDRTSEIAVEIAADKSLTKEILSEAYIPVPVGREVESEFQLESAFGDLTVPVVVKPLDANQGKGVSLNIQTLDEARTAFAIANQYGSTVLIEEQFRGHDFRVLVIGDRVVAASRRVPANVVGDGHHTISELIDIANRDPRRGTDHDKPLTQISIDSVAAVCLQRRGIALEMVPQAGERVLLRENANLSTGGEAHNVTVQLHPAIAELCVRAARLVGLDVAGIDLVAQDIARPLQRGEGIIEVNASPGLRMHVHPSDGPSIAAGEAIIQSMFVPGDDGRIPIVAVTGTNGKTTTARMIAHALMLSGTRVGLTTTDGIYIDGKSLGHSDAAGPYSAGAVLADATVEAAVFETARGGIIRRGLAFDWCDVGVITNIRPDHIGQDGIRDLDDLIWIKSLVAERVRPGGTLVINADDESARSVLERKRVRANEKLVVLYSESATNPYVQAHLAAGGYALFVRGDLIVEAYNSIERPLVRFRDVPITFGGLLPYNVSNCMAALAAARALAVPEQIAVQAALTFSPQHNPGRGNIYAVKEGYVMLDYGHNADAFTAVGRLRQVAAAHRLVGVVSVPGDRADEVIANGGRAAAEVFDRVLIREDDDLRGRKPGETASLTCRAVHEARPEVVCDIVGGGEVEALGRALDEMQQGDVVVMFYDHLEPVVQALERAGARQIVPAQFAESWMAMADSRSHTAA
jgi:cyanophycin synthetase